MTDETVVHSNLDTKTRVKSILGGSAGNLVEWYGMIGMSMPHLPCILRMPFSLKAAKQLNYYKLPQSLPSASSCAQLALGLWGFTPTKKAVNQV